MIEGGEDPKFIARRMVIFASEDVGLAAPEAVQQVTALAQAWELCRRWSGFYVDPQHVVMAILLLARAPKSTEVDDAKNWVIQKRKGGWRPEVPEYALDVHTEQGRQMGRTEEDWYRERNQVIPGNPYRKALARLKNDPLLEVTHGLDSSGDSESMETGRGTM